MSEPLQPVLGAKHPLTLAGVPTGFLPWLAAVSWWPWMLLAAERLAHPEAALGRALALGSATLAAQLLLHQQTG